MPDRATKLDTFDPREQKVVIHPFKLNPDIASGVNKEFVKELGQEMAIDIRSLLFEKGYKNVIIDGASKEGDYLVKGKITEVSGGSKHQRIWLGFGYGGTIVSARGEIVDLKNAKVVMDFNITKQSNWTYSDNEAAVRENVYEIAKELVDKALAK
ncbi:MAG: DUF4410 domain-containing protein [Candidatus Heimdallarchaeota archaeon]